MWTLPKPDPADFYKLTQPLWALATANSTTTGGSDQPLCNFPRYQLPYAAGAGKLVGLALSAATMSADHNSQSKIAASLRSDLRVCNLTVGI